MANKEISLTEFLRHKDVRLGEYEETLIEQGVEKIDDLKDVDKEILTRDIKMKPIQANRLLRSVSEHFSLVSYDIYL